MRKRFRILLTENCNANCKGCFNANYRSKRDMAMEDFQEISTYLAQNKIEILKVMGGEPTVHPRFEEAMVYAQGLFPRVSIFTNALNERIKNFRPRPRDVIIYNFSCMDRGFDYTKLLLDQPGGRGLEVKIASDTNLPGYIQQLREVCHYTGFFPDRQFKINLTLDCTENIFTHQEEIIEKWNTMFKFIVNELHIPCMIDHRIPRCFSDNSPMVIDKVNQVCHFDCAGLIDTGLNLRHCNQHPGKLIGLRQGKDFLPYPILENYLLQARIHKLQLVMDKTCLECFLFPEECNGGCFMHKSFIGREDVLTARSSCSRSNYII